MVRFDGKRSIMSLTVVSLVQELNCLFYRLVILIMEVPCVSEQCHNVNFVIVGTAQVELGKRF